jgi:hypothetical protein
VTDFADNDFARGAQIMREVQARFIEQGGDATTAASVRANWVPGWGTDPGPPPAILDTWEAPECPEGEALYAKYCKSVSGDEDHAPDLSPQGLAATADMLERWAIPFFPANKLGQIPFVRGLIEVAIRDLRAKAMRDGGFLGPTIASAIEARRAETGTGSVHESAVAQPDAQGPVK